MFMASLTTVIDVSFLSAGCRWNLRDRPCLRMLQCGMRGGGSRSTDVVIVAPQGNSGASRFGTGAPAAARGITPRKGDARPGSFS